MKSFQDEVEAVPLAAVVGPAAEDCERVGAAHGQFEVVARARAVLTERPQVGVAEDANAADKRSDAAYGRVGDSPLLSEDPEPQLGSRLQALALVEEAP